MSYVLEAIVVGVAELSADAESEGFNLLPIGERSTILARPGRVVCNESTETFALALSKQFGEALLIRWDDRIGLRASSVYRDGQLLREFTAEDELWAAVDDDGNPIADGQRYTEAELDALDDDEEYGTVVNALELGCEHSNVCSWQDLRKFISQGD